MATYPLTERAILLRSEDDVAIAKKELSAGTVLRGRTRPRSRSAPTSSPATRSRATRSGSGEPVRRYGQVIGFATQDIAVGDHVHTHNLDIGELSADRYEVGVDVTPVAFYPPDQMRYFDGFKREDGRVGTRNYVAIISGVNCSASVSQFVKEKFRDVQQDFPNVDGVLAITHKSGCGTKLFGEDHMALQRVLAGYAKHPTSRPTSSIGLGCEVNQAAVMIDRQKMSLPGHAERKPFLVNIQEAGGIRKTVERAARRGRQAPADRQRARSGRSSRSSELTLGHQLRRLRRQLRHHRQPGAGLGGGRAGALRRHRRAGRDARDLRRRAPADPARGQRGRGQEAHRSLQVVGVVLPRHRRRWTTTPRPATRPAGSPPSSRSRSAASPRAGPRR